MNQFVKMWAVRVSVDAAPGDVATVTKADGSETVVTLAALAPGETEGPNAVWLIVPTRRARR